MIRRVGVVAAAIAGIYLLLALAFVVVQRRVIFPAPQGARPLPPGGTVVRGEGFVALDAPIAGARGTVALFHGNGEDLADAAPMIGAWQAAGYSAFAIEYPGYGIARELGSPSENAILASAERSLTWLRAQAGRPATLVLQGQSLGTAVAVEMAQRGFGERLVLISPFTSLADMAQHVAPWLPTRLLLRDRFDTAAIAAQVQQTVLIVHGTADEVVPVDMGIRLAALFPRVQLRLIRGGRHNDLLAVHGPALRKALLSQAR